METAEVLSPHFLQILSKTLLSRSRIVGAINKQTQQRVANKQRTPRGTAMTATTANPVDNGVNVEALLGARQALTETPAAAAFVWKASSEWVNGTHTKTTVSNFFGLGEEQARKADHIVDTDHPEQFAAEDNGMSPIEMVLAGLAGCLSAGVASVAQNRGIQLNSVTANLEGDCDLRGIMGIDRDVRNGFGAVRVNFEIDADASAEEIQGLVAQSQKRSAVYDVIANPTIVSVELAR